MLVESSLLVSGVLARSGLPIDLNANDTYNAFYTEFTFNTRDPERPKTIVIKPASGGTIIRSSEIGSDFETSVSVSVDASGQITSKHISGYEDADEDGHAIDELLETLPTLKGSIATINVLVRPEQ